MGSSLIRTVTLVAVTFITAVVHPSRLIAQSTATPAELIRRVVQNELRAERQDTSHWMFRLETVNKKGHPEVDEVVETKNGDVKRPLVIDGRKLTPKERRQADQQLGRNPRAVKKSQNYKNQDAQQSQQMLKMLPDAFTFSSGEKKGDLVQLNFKPNPQFHPNNHEAQVFHAMAGSIWVDEKQNRLAEISGRLMRRVNFGGGLLGHLDKDGTFDVKQQMISPGYWELTQLNVQMNGKALFFKTISVRQKYSRSEFKRVPDDISIDQAVKMLKQQPVEQARR